MQRLADLYRYIPTHSPLQKLEDALYKKHGVKLYFKRDDLLHSQFGGNKARKLYGHIQALMQGKYNGWITWGGPWSNHLHAFAAFSHTANIPFHVIIRGNDLTYCTPLMDFIERCGGHIHFVSREKYNQTKWGDVSNILMNGNWYGVPEGGGGNPGKIGCNLLAQEILEAIQPQRICLAVGTQTTLEGLAEKTTCAITGFSALKGLNKLNDSIEITDEFCLGGYAKTSAALMDFILDFYQQHHILLDPVYTGKLMMGVHQRIACGDWDGETIVVIHSGGSQGIFGYPELLQSLRNLDSEILKEIYEVRIKK
jgi:1-aminocyclopropane-1-carboxylate deaminase